MSDRLGGCGVVFSSVHCNPCQEANTKEDEAGAS